MKTKLLLSLFIVRALTGAAHGVEDVKVSPDVVYGHKDGMAMTLDVYKPKEPNGAGVLFIISGGWYSRWWAPDPNAWYFKTLLEADFTLFAVRHGSSPKYKVPEMIEDLHRAVRFVRLHAREQGVDPDRLGITGASAGGHLSLLLGTTADGGNSKAKDKILRQSNRVAAIVAVCPPSDLREWAQPTSEYHKKFPALRFDLGKAVACSPVLQASKDDPPMLMIHGDKDVTVPIAHSQKMAEALREKGVTAKVHVIKGAGHSFKGNDFDNSAEAMVDWFKQYLVAEKK